MSLSGGSGSIISHKVIDMDETRLQTISQLQAFLAGTLEVRFCVPHSDDARYAQSLAQGDARFERLAGLCVSHLYNLRHGKTYLNQHVSFTKTRPVVNVKVTGAARLYRAASGGPPGWASLFGEREIGAETGKGCCKAAPKPSLNSR